MRLLMVEEGEQSEQGSVSVQKRTDKYKTYALYFFVALSAFLVYYVTREELVLFVVKGEHLVLLSLVAFAAYYFWHKRSEVAELPPKDVIAIEISDWYFSSGYGFLDFTKSEVEVISRDRAYAYFPLVEKTFIYQAGKGVIGERWKDIEESIIDRERSSLITAYESDASGEAKVREKLQRMGFDTE